MASTRSGAARASAGLSKQARGGEREWERPRGGSVPTLGGRTEQDGAWQWRWGAQFA
jgi:hypothetical protein